MQSYQAAKEKASGLFAARPTAFRNAQYENFEVDQKSGYEQTFGDGGSPESLPSPDRPPLRHIDKYVRAECPCLSTRYTLALLACFGFSITFGMRCNMSMAKLKMTELKTDVLVSNNAPNVTAFNVTAFNATGGNGTEHNSTAFFNNTIHISTPLFNWSVGMESAIDSSYFAGYLITQVPGGFMASLYPANRIFGTAIVISALLNMAIPGAMNLSPVAVIIIKVAQGFVEGVTYPACHGIWRMWAPPMERSRLATVAFCGSYAGIVVGMPLSGLLSDKIGWQSPFYFYGVGGVVWYLFWIWLCFERPSKHPAITARELAYIENSLGQQSQAAMPTFWNTPWNEFARSLPVYAIIVANFCRTWNFCLLVIFQSAYFNTRFGMQITESGFVGAVPHLIMTSIVPIGGLLADYLRKNNIMTTTNVRKLFNCGGFGLEAFFFLLVAYADNKWTATIELTLGVAFSGFAISGYNVNHLDIAPRYASILMGLSNGIGTIAGFIVPIVIDHMTEDRSNLQKAIVEWREVFLMAATVHFIGITFYAVFASGELQPWAEPPPDQDPRFRQKSFETETTFMNQPHGEPPAYGSLGAPPARPPALGAPPAPPHVPNNPFVGGALYEAEPVQPAAHHYRDPTEATY